MPIYTYGCRKCGKDSDVLVGVTSLSEKIVCEFCGSNELDKKMSAFSVGAGSLPDTACGKAPSNHSCSGCPHGGHSCSME